MKRLVIFTVKTGDAESDVRHTMKLPSRKVLLWLLPLAFALPELSCCGWLDHALWLVPVLLVLLVANLWLFLTRGWEDSFYPTDYASLYYPLDAPGVRAWVVEKGNVLRLELVWSKTPVSWEVLINGKLVQTIPSGGPLRIKVPEPNYDGKNTAPLSEFKQRCTLRPLPVGIGPELEFTIYGLSTELYRRAGMSWQKDVAYLVYTDLPTGKFTRLPVSYWMDDCSHMDSAALAAADRVVREDMGVTDSDDTLTRMEKVARHLRLKLVNAGGIPKNDLRWINPWQLWLEMTGGTGKGWCTQHAQLFTFFANRAGVPTRFVFGANTADRSRIVHTGHSWCESWVKEQNRWAFVDESQAIVCVKGKNGALLNTADILHLCEHEAFGGITARVYAADGRLTALKDWAALNINAEADASGFATIPFEHISALYRQEFGRQAIIKYRRPPNVEDVREVYSMLLKNWTFAWVNFDRYLFSPPPAYSLLPTDGRRTYCVRQSLFVGMLATLLVLGAYFVRG